MQGSKVGVGRASSADGFVAHLKSRGAQVIDRRGYWLVTCPAHDDREPSLSVRPGQEQPVMFKCFGGCTHDDVLAAAGLDWSDVLPRSATRSMVVGKLLPCDDHGAHSPNFEWFAVAMWQALRADHPEARAELVGQERPQGERDYVERSRDVFGVECPKGAGKVMRMVLEDFVNVLNERRARGEVRAVPYGSRWVAERLGIPDRAARKAISSLVAAGALEPQGELSRQDAKRYGGTPLYALVVDVPCPMGACEVEAAALVGLDDEATAAAGDPEAPAQPAVEVVEQPAMPVAELEDVVGAGLAAPVGGAGSVGHGTEQYADRWLAFV